MTSIHYRLHDSETRKVDAADGESIMRTAVSNDVPGIVGECGGELSCATCHIYVDPQWADRVPPRSLDEEDMLEMVESRTEYSRLSCQIRVSPELDGLEVQVGQN
jgi:2Fe-2S ferredoxin